VVSQERLPFSRNDRRGDSTISTAARHDMSALSSEEEEEEVLSPLSPLIQIQAEKERW
jgi:hypothetical protein